MGATTNVRSLLFELPDLFRTTGVSESVFMLEFNNLYRQIVIVDEIIAVYYSSVTAH